MEESKRIKSFKSRLIKELPFFPNNKETLSDLESQNLNSILIHYLHWKTRLVPARFRKVQIAPEVTADKIINMPNKTLLPGLIDTHTHLSNDPGGDFWRQAVDSEEWGTVVAAKNANITV